MLAVAETLHQHRLQIDAIENSIVSLRGDLKYRAGANALDLAFAGICGDSVMPQDTMIAFAQVGDLWHPVAGRSGMGLKVDELAEYPVIVVLTMTRVLQPLAHLFKEPPHD